MISQIRARARRQLHDHMSENVVLHINGAEPRTVGVRIKSNAVGVGDFDQGRYAGAEMASEAPTIIYIFGEIPELVNGAHFQAEDAVYRVEQVDEPHGITGSARCVRLNPRVRQRFLEQLSEAEA